METLILEEHALAEAMATPLSNAQKPTLLTILAIFALFSLLILFNVFSLFGRVAAIFRQLTTESNEDWDGRQL